jgi:hypothetical protein
LALERNEYPEFLSHPAALNAEPGRQLYPLKLVVFAEDVVFVEAEIRIVPTLDMAIHESHNPLFLPNPGLGVEIWQVLRIIFRIGDERQAELAAVVQAVYGFGLRFGLGQHRQKHPRQNGDDRKNHLQAECHSSAGVMIVIVITPSFFVSFVNFMVVI